MKLNLIEISLAELRDFIKLSSENGKNIKDFSLINLKLRLQFIISGYDFKNFNSFYNHLKNNPEFFQDTIQKIHNRNDELFRDAEYWIIFLEILKKQKVAEEIKVFLFESGGYADTCTLIILLKEFDLLSQTTLSIIDLSEATFPFKYLNFNSKQMEAAEINCSALNFKTKIKNYFIEKQNYFEFSTPLNFNMSQISFSKDETQDSLEELADVIIAKNLTMMYNQNGAEKLITQYAAALKKGGLLFCGIREDVQKLDIKQEFILSSQEIPLYLKK